ncbi:MAG: RNase adapter RapZ [Clostridiales bacterium]|nr:RNase adapter RapZ [Clostridiales bacterium]
MKYVVVTGMSGAGKATALRFLEDMGYFCVDNLPLPLLEKFFELTEGGDQVHRQLVLGLDIRNGQSLHPAAETIDLLKEEGKDISILYLDADDEVLLKRYKETRRIPPLAGTDRIEMGIARERSQISFLKEKADYIIDTSRLLTWELNLALENIFHLERQYDNLFVTVLSFGFKYGIPSDADLVFDVRFLPNPYYIETLRPKTGNDPEIRQFVMQSPEAGLFLDKLEDMIRFLIPNYVREGKHRLVIAIGCTGGKHHSVTLANGIYLRLQEDQTYGLRVEHRDLDKDAKRGK